MDPGQTLADQWTVYVNPFNNLFLYCAGIALFYNGIPLGKLQNLACFFVAVSLFTFYPASGDQINIVTGPARLAFCVASILLVLAFYKNTVRLPNVLSMPLTQLGVVTYGVYLLHPIVYSGIRFSLKRMQFELPGYGMVGLTIGLTILLSLVTFKILEEPFVRLGKRLTSRDSGKSLPVQPRQVS